MLGLDKFLHVYAITPTISICSCHFGKRRVVAVVVRPTRVARDMC